jgi:putative phosphoesterase
MNDPSLLVLSDSHGHLLALKAVFRWALNRDFRAGIFLGDGAEDIPLAAAETGLDLIWRKVRGNGDMDYKLPDTETLDLGGHRFFLCHGHYYRLYNGFDSLIAAARNLGAEAALFGHSHIPMLDEEEGIKLINPGSVGRPRSKVGASFAVIECPTEQPIRVQFWRIKQGARGFSIGPLKSS